MTLRRPHAAHLARGAALLATVALAGCSAGFAPQGPPGATDLGALGCQVGPQPGATIRDGDPLAAGQPMAGVDVAAMTPRQVGELARSRGLKATWRYDIRIAGGVNGPVGQDVPGVIPGMTPPATPGATRSAVPEEPASASPDVSAGNVAMPSLPAGVAVGSGAFGFSECWCEPPPTGRVIGVAFGMASELVVFVDSGLTLPAPREQPARGWGC